MKDYYLSGISETIDSLGSDFNKGLSETERRKRLVKYGENLLPEAKSKSFILRFISQFANFMIFILLFAAGLSFYASYLSGEIDYLEPAIILFILIFNAFLGTIQEIRAEKSLNALKKCQSASTNVLVDGKFISLPSKTLVPGDIIDIRQGTIVPADARIIEAISLKVDESALTGESEAVIKDPDIKLSASCSLGDRKNMLYSSTVVTTGHCKAIVTQTGINTEIGHIAKMIRDDKAPITPMTKRMNSVSKVLGISCILICCIIFVIGIFQKQQLIDMFLTSISLAVASIPEGLPAVVTIMLSIGILRLARQRCIMRNLSAVETLGRISIICSDKTGTLTQNQMNIADFYSPKGHSENEFHRLLKYAYTNTTATEGIGDATELAIISKARKYNINKFETGEEKISEIPFSSGRKAMVTVTKNKDKINVYVKGAFDRIYPLCTKSKQGADKNAHDSFAKNAYRVLCIAKKEMNDKEYKKLLSKISSMPKKTHNNNSIKAYKKASSTDTSNTETDILYDELAKDFTFCGLLALSDPPRPEVTGAIRRAKDAGIRTVMITGDHAGTAKAIAKQIGIASENAITGKEIDESDDTKLAEICKKTSVFARVSPGHKVRLVKAFQSLGACVVMTGDGINDAPALNAADIGAAMGKTGTDVAKEASDMILTDDNYTTIVNAIACGRGIIDNIKKSIHFLLSCNAGEILTVLFALIAGSKSPLLAIQLLWINLITDSLPAIAIGMEKPEANILKGSGDYQVDATFTPLMIFRIALEGSLIASLSLIGYLSYGCTGCFVVLGISELLHSFNLRSEKSILKRKNRNKYVYGSFIICSILQLSVVLIKPLAKCFSLTPLSLPALLTLFALSSVIIVVCEIEKFLFN